MPSIINGLFSGRSGISSHGTAIAVVGDNISNASTIGYKSSRAEFEDLIAGGQASGRVVGSGSTISAVSTVFEQGTLEFTSRPLDLAVDGNGLFVVKDSGGQHFYTRAGNFKVDSSGFIVNQNGLEVLGFPTGGSGALEALNINTTSQSNVSTGVVTVSGNVDASASIAASVPTTNTNVGSPVTYAQLNASAQFSTVVDVFDSLGAQHTVTLFFYHTASNTYQVHAYVNRGDITAAANTTPAGATSADPYEIGSKTIAFNTDGTRTTPPTPSTPDFTATPAWNNGASAGSVKFNFDPFTQFSSSATVSSINQDGKGIGTVTSLSIEKNGNIFALLSNGQSSVIGTIGLANFSNVEGLVRTGNQLLQQSQASGEPIIGQPETGTYGAVQSGSVELSTVDIANEFVKLITLQRGFQANSRIITTINQLLNDIIQLA